MNPPNSISDFLRTPFLWRHLPRLIAARVLKRDSLQIHHPGYVLSAGLAKGHGLWCALAGRHYEPELDWVLRTIPEDSVVIDVGANIGAYAIAIGIKCSPSGKVFAFEPGSGAFERLLHNIHVNQLGDRVIALKMAASSQSGTACWDTMGDKWNSAHIVRSAYPNPSNTRVETIRIDDLIEKNSLKRLDLIKIDAEGHEADVIKGAWESIKTFSPVLIYEHIISELSGEQHTDLLDLGYSLYTLEQGRLVSFSSKQQPESPNIIAIHGKKSGS